MKTILNLFLILNTAVSAIAFTACVSLKPQTNIPLNNTRFHFVEDTTYCSSSDFEKDFFHTTGCETRIIDGKRVYPYDNSYQLSAFSDSILYFLLSGNMYAFNVFTQNTKNIGDSTIQLHKEILANRQDNVHCYDRLSISKNDSDLIIYCKNKAGIYCYNTKSKENTPIAESCRKRIFLHFILLENKNQIFAEAYYFDYKYCETYQSIYLIDSIHTKPIIKLLLKQQP